MEFSANHDHASVPKNQQQYPLAATIIFSDFC